MKEHARPLGGAAHREIVKVERVKGAGLLFHSTPPCSNLDTYLLFSDICCSRALYNEPLHPA